MHPIFCGRGRTASNTIDRSNNLSDNFFINSSFVLVQRTKKITFFKIFRQKVTSWIKQDKNEVNKCGVIVELYILVGKSETEAT